MPGYAKLFSTIITSSIWSEDDKTRLMWVTMLASADAHGYVSGSVPGMAAIARMSIEDARHSIDVLCAPDPDSRTKDQDGRRLLACDGGWLIVNYAKYREQRDPETRTQQNRDAQQRWRERHRKPNVSQNKPLVSPCKPKQKQKHIEEKRKRGTFVPPTPAQVDEYAQSIGYIRPNLGRDFCAHYVESGWRIKGGQKMTDWHKAVRTWRRVDEQNPRPQASRPDPLETVAPLARGADGLTPRERLLQQEAR